MKKQILLVVLIGVLFGGAYLVTLNSQKDIVLDENYINSEILLGSESVDEILFIDKSDEYVACLCSSNKNELMMLILENNKYYDLCLRYSFSLNLLTDTPHNIMTDRMLSTGDKVVYNVFLNPTQEIIQVDGIQQEIKRFSYFNGKSDYTIGFWWFVQGG